jgi:polyhydroxyalkanoate synthase
MSALASPKAFVWERYVDAALSVSDPQAFDIHMRVERWALDEVALPGKLVRQIVDWLYREDRLSNGTLNLNGKRITPADVTTPVLAVVNTDDEVSPLTSVKPFMDALPGGQSRIIECSGELGVGLQHLGVLVGRQAHARVWPEILGWIKALN